MNRKRNFTFLQNRDGAFSATEDGRVPSGPQWAASIAMAHPTRRGVMPGVMFNRDGDGGNAGSDDSGGTGTGDASGADGKPSDDKADDKKPTYEELEAQFQQMQRSLKKANKEAETSRRALDELRGKGDGKPGDDGKGDKGDDAAKLKQQLADANDKSRKRLIRAAVMIEASKIGFHDPADAFALADLSEIEVDDESDDVTGVEDALKALAKRKPHLVKADKPEDGNGQRKSPAKPDTNATSKGGNKAGELQVDEDAIRRKYSIR